MSENFNPEPTSDASSSSASTDILNTTGTNSGDGFLGDLSLGGIFGFKNKNSFYTEFYNSLLATANCPPINALWLVFIQDMPSNIPVMYQYRTKDNGRSLSYDTYSKASSEGRRTRGILLAQGVKHTGDGTDFSREGYKNTGLWKGVLSNGRSEINTLDISFLESNVSFVDYALRPWAIAVAHSGLTNPLLYANNITVWHLSKMGARTNFARRKVFKYHNCFPISIDQQEYNYSGDDVNVQRAVSFGYHYYTMEDADQAVLDLLGYPEKERNFLSKALDYFGVGDLAENALDEIRSQFGANNVGQYLNNVVGRARSFASSVISNTVEGAITNVAGAVQGAVDGAIRDVTSSGLAAGNNLVSNVSESVNDSVNSIVGRNPNSDTVQNVEVNLNSQTAQNTSQALSENASYQRLAQYGYVEKSISANDKVENILPLIDEDQQDLISSSKIDLNKTINQNDTPNNLTNDVTQNEDGGITIQRNFATGNPNDDTPNFLGSPTANLLYYVEKDIGGFSKGVENAVESNINTVESAFELTIKTNQDDATIGDDLGLYQEKEINDGEDTPATPDYQQKLTPEEDSNPSATIQYNQIENRDDDSNPSQTIRYNQLENPINDSTPSESVRYNQIETPKNDSTPSESIAYNEIKNPINDSTPSESINYNQIETTRNDSNPSESISYNQIETPRNDSNPSESITYKEVKINNNDSVNQTPQ